MCETHLRRGLSRIGNTFIDRGHLVDGSKGRNCELDVYGTVNSSCKGREEWEPYLEQILIVKFVSESMNVLW